MRPFATDETRAMAEETRPQTKPRMKPYVEAIHAYVPGKSKSADGRELVKLSANENPLGCSPAALEALEQVQSPAPYPDPGSTALRDALAEREAAASGEYQEKSEIGWGHQIRSYVLQPYQMVKDLRTGVVSPSPDAVLDGGIDDFISAALAQRVTGEQVEVEDVE